jgi:hypothetical protein
MRKLLLLALLLAPAAMADEPKPEPKIEDLQKEYERIRASLFTSRARAAAVGSTLYSSKLQVFLRYGTPRFFHVGRALVRLDGAAIYDDAAGAIGTDDVMRFEGFVAPGKHQLTVRVDAETKDDTTFASSTESTFTIDVPNHKLLVVRAAAEDGGDMGSTFAKKGRGGYRLHLDVDAEARELDERR